MGILDEAIRDHLELKRQHGAESDELKRLEDEAFGPPTRPGEPDFPETGTAAVEPAAATNGEVGPSTQEEEAAPTPLPAEGAPAAAESPPIVADEAPPREPSTEEEAAEHPAVADSSEAETTLYDHTLDEDLDFEELGLTLDDEAAEAEAGESPPEPEPAPAAEAPEPPPAPEAVEEPPIESLETVEHPFEPESDQHAAPADEPGDQELGHEELAEDELAEDELADEPASEELELEEPASEELEGEEPADHYDEEEEASEQGEPESSEEDVLADTPEFLRDRPEDDELWFEQGKPKDFDFD